MILVGIRWTIDFHHIGTLAFERIDGGFSENWVVLIQIKPEIIGLVRIAGFVTHINSFKIG